MHHRNYCCCYRYSDEVCGGCNILPRHQQTAHVCWHCFWSVCQPCHSLLQRYSLKTYCLSWTGGSQKFTKLTYRAWLIILELIDDLKFQCSCSLSKAYLCHRSHLQGQDSLSLENLKKQLIAYVIRHRLEEAKYKPSSASDFLTSKHQSADKMLVLLSM